MDWIVGMRGNRKYEGNTKVLSNPNWMDEVALN